MNKVVATQVYQVNNCTILEPLDKNRNNREYTNGEITVYWRPAECIHATTCFVKLRSVFNPGKRPWVNMNGASTEEIIDIVDQCPTDALTYKWNKDIGPKEVETQADEQKAALCITVVKDGPLVCKGTFILTDDEGNDYRVYKTTPLCRCGYSQRQPYCDGRHQIVRFTDEH